MTVTQDRTAPQKTAAAVPKIRPLPIAKMLPSSDNRRRPITKASVESLARSMKSDGLIQPVVVRPHPSRKGFWEIRAGERRWHAAKSAGLTHLPAIIRKLDDQSALSVTLAENIQRENFHPLEEAATIQLAFERGYDVKAIAAHLGKPLSYIARRASLTKLAKVWKDEILRPESDASRLTALHLELIARLPEETQKALAEHDFEVVFGRGFPTVTELRRIIDGGLHSLIAMPWPLDDETLDPKAGSCLTCTKRSGKQPLLFDDEEAPKNGKVSKTDRCLDPSCYDRKKAAYLGRCETTLRGKHPNLRLVQVTYERMPPATHKAFGDRVLRAYQPTFAKPNQANATPVMPIDGPKAGQLVYLTLAQTESHKHGNGRVKSKKGPLTMAERRAALQRRRQAFVVKRIEGILKGLSDDDLGKIARRWRARIVQRTKRRSTGWRFCWLSAQVRAKTDIRIPTRGRPMTGCARDPRPFAPSRPFANWYRSGHGGSLARTAPLRHVRRRMPSACVNYSESTSQRSNAMRQCRFLNRRVGGTRGKRESNSLTAIIRSLFSLASTLTQSRIV